MNQRIEEVAALAWEHADRNSRDGDGRFGHLYRDEFARLLLEECTELTLDYKNADHYQGWIDFRDAIRDHFGMK